MRGPTDPHARRIALLRRAFAEHNRLVILVAILALIIAAALWYLLYAALFCLAFLASPVFGGMNGHPPEAFPALFIYAAGLLVLLTWVAGKYSPNEVLKNDKSLLEIASEFLLIVPRATLAVWGNLSAWQRLSPDEIEMAADFLEHLDAARRIPLYHVALDIPNAGARMRILLALQLTGQIRVHRTDGEVWIAPAPKREVAQRE